LRALNRMEKTRTGLSRGSKVVKRNIGNKTGNELILERVQITCYMLFNFQLVLDFLFRELDQFPSLQ